MTPTAERRRAFEAVWTDPGGFLGQLRTVQNTPLATRYLVAAFVFFLAGGVQALVMRLHLARPEAGLLDEATYNALFTMHGTTMMFLFVIPFLEALAVYLLPLMLGARELPFPRMTALSFWTYVFGGLFLYTSFVVGTVPDAGWFAYLPLAGPEYSPGLGLDFWDIGLSVAEIAAMGAAAELIVGILRMRAPGMSLARLPLYAWAMLVTGVMIIFAFTPLIVGTAMLELDRKGLTRFFDPDAGGKPLLWQHIFWVFGHPEVYIMFVPAVGIVSQVVQAFTGRPVVGYILMVMALVATGFISFGLWVHHMFATGLAPLALAFFTAATMMIAIPNGVQIFAWIITMGSGRPRWHPALLFVVGFLAIFVLGGLTGVMLAAVPFNWQVHDTYFVVAHFHYVLIGGVLFPVFAGLYYWLPKITGRLLSERLGRWNFWLMFVFFNLTFFPMHIVGLLGMPRRVAVYPDGLGWTGYNVLTTVGALGFGVAVLLFVVNVAWSLRAGCPAGADPWRADTLEWAESSPPPTAQFAEIPVVMSRHPLWAPPAAPPDPALARVTSALDHAPTRWRGALAVSALDGRPVAIVHVPGPTIFPFVVAVGFVALLVAALRDSFGLAIVGMLVTLVGITGWFWPRRSERLAMEEMAGAEDGGLPLGIAGPLSNGWWATVVLILILTTALGTFVASYFYLGDGTLAWAPVQPQATLPGIATLVLLAGGGAMLAAVATLRRAKHAQRRLWLVLATLTGVGFIALTAWAYRASGLVAADTAYGSIVFGLLGFQWIVTVLALAMLTIAQLWAWLAPPDARGHAVLLNAALVQAFAVASWMVVALTVYVTPRLG
ncbi:MAG: cbb3-type cytochrome c oxidase subunit I [Candidatus Rokuibacteriota bacterium]